MSTTYSKRSAEIQQMSSVLQQGQQQASDADWNNTLSTITNRLTIMQPELAHMKAKADEQDPDKRIFGKAMATKVTSCAHLSFDICITDGHLQWLVCTCIC